ncbi:MAG: response regulator [Pseudoxanthomonas sp.]|jgi:putative two-component system response regulator|uniref:response regulator n=1 Tax=Pseudoxanthomonas TaxID=83618 RepID=UPI00138A5A48|nr:MULTISPECIES: HD domain-containing phosphohydrolase [Pseudoxanthomonas]KAF1729175.1 two-component system response regulator [Pseudoxanthomonas mexicana]MCH2091928.1 response regulator [Pseudoxanthomonas sp.]
MPTGPILCVDDEPNNLALFRQILGEDYRLVFARDGDQALRAAEKHAPSLVLLDVEMPGMDGYEVAWALKARAATEHIPIIFVTALDREVDERTGFACGGVDYITKPVSPFILRARVNTHLSLVRTSALSKSYEDAIQMLSVAGHYNDSDTGAHIWRMAAYARVLAEALGWKADRARLLEQAAPMHDTGKIGIPDAILKKPGKLNPREWDVMQRHTLIGYEILSRSKAPLFELAAEVALNHHERWDGTGYPHGLAGDRIPESARIVAIADVFDALASRRPYKEAWPVDVVVAKIIESRGTHFDPAMTDAFVACLPKILEVKAYWDRQEGDAAGGLDPIQEEA